MGSFVCSSCGQEFETLKVRCTNCNVMGRVQYSAASSSSSTATHAADSPPIASSPVKTPVVVAVSAPKPVFKAPATPASASAEPVAEPSRGPMLSMTIRPKRTGSPERVSPKLLPSAPALVPLPAGNVALVRSEAGRAKAVEILKTFAASGLLVRSVQMQHVECVTSADIAFDPDTGVVAAGTWLDGYTYAHPTIVQNFFQLQPNGGNPTGVEGKRAMALLIDWTKTSDRYFDYSLKDMSANKQALHGAKTRGAKQCEVDLAEVRKALGDGKTHDNNEIRFIQIRKAALVGLIWCPIPIPTALSDGRATWDEESKGKFRAMIVKFKAAGAAAEGLPIFTYGLGACMTLEYLDFLA